MLRTIKAGETGVAALAQLPARRRRQHQLFPIPEHRDEDLIAVRERSQGLDDQFDIFQLSTHLNPLYHHDDVPAQKDLEFADCRRNGARAQAQPFSQIGLKAYMLTFPSAIVYSPDIEHGDVIDEGEEIEL